MVSIARRIEMTNDPMSLEEKLALLIYQEVERQFKNEPILEAKGPFEEQAYRIECTSNIKISTDSIIEFSSSLCSSGGEFGSASCISYKNRGKFKVYVFEFLAGEKFLEMMKNNIPPAFSYHGPRPYISRS